MSVAADKVVPVSDPGSAESRGDVCAAVSWYSVAGQDRG